MRLRTVLFIEFGWEWSAGVRGSLQKDEEYRIRWGGIFGMEKLIGRDLRKTRHRHVEPRRTRGSD
jgi:hypothetical protein